MAQNKTTSTNQIIHSPRPCDPSRFYNDCKIRIYDYQLALRPTTSADGDGIKKTGGEGEEVGGGKPGILNVDGMAT